ncbi:MAG: O-antigen ligase family protein [Actinomycetota bacterium]
MLDEAAPHISPLRLRPDQPAVEVAGIPLPSFTERVLVVLTTFIVFHFTPNAWFVASSEDGPASNPIYIVATLGLIGIAFIRVAGYFNLLIETIKLEPTVFWFTGLVLVSSLWSADRIETVKAAIIFTAVTLYATYLVMRFSLDQIVRLLAVMFSISAVLNLLFVLALPVYGIDDDGLWTGVFSQKNALGFITALSIPVLIIAGREWRGGRPLFFAAIAMHAVLLWGSQSKTMLVAAIVPTAAIAFFQLFRSGRTLPGAVMVGFIGSGIFAVAFATANIALLADWLDKDVSLTGRVPLWEDLLVVMWESPLLGYGYDAAFGGYFSPVHDVWIQNPWDPSHAHNALLQIWLDIGVFGVLLFLVLYFRSLTRAVRVASSMNGAVGLWPLVFLTMTLLISITESGMTANSLGWMMLVVAALTVSGHLRALERGAVDSDARPVRLKRQRAAALSATT